MIRHSMEHYKINVILDTTYTIYIIFGGNIYFVRTRFSHAFVWGFVTSTGDGEGQKGDPRRTIDPAL